MHRSSWSGGSEVWTDGEMTGRLTKEASLTSIPQLTTLAKCSAHLSRLADSVVGIKPSKAVRVDVEGLEKRFLVSLSSLIKEPP